MASGGTGNIDVFDVRKVRRLVELMNEHDLAEIDLRQSDQRIRLRRGQEPAISAASIPQAPMGAPATTPVAAAASVPPAASVAEGAPDDEKVAYITSPMVGTFYVASSPEAASYIKIGDQVGPESIVCVIEAMKVYNEIPAECSGKVVSLLVENGDPVEYGQKLFKLQS